MMPRHNQDPARTRKDLMADGVKPKKTTDSQTSWTLYTLAVATGIAITLAAIFSQIF